MNSIVLDCVCLREREGSRSTISMIGTQEQDSRPRHPFGLDRRIAFRDALLSGPRSEVTINIKDMPPWQPLARITLPINYLELANGTSRSRQKSL